MKSSIVVSKFDSTLVAFKQDDIMCVKSISSVEELRFFNINIKDTKVILRKYRSIEDITAILNDYEHNN